MNLFHLFDGFGIVEFTDVEIAHRKSAFRFQPLFDAFAGDETGRNHEVIF